MGSRRGRGSRGSRLRRTTLVKRRARTIRRATGVLVVVALGMRLMPMWGGEGRGRAVETAGVDVKVYACSTRDGLYLGKR